jgi:vacuolar-type H+-ATPase catalytic subunit A/Vma1
LKQTLSYIEISGLQARLSGITDDLMHSRLSTRIVDILDVASFIDKDFLFNNSLYKSYLPLLYCFSKVSVIETD